MARGKQARAAIGLFDEFARAEQKDPTGRSLVALWDQRASELPGIPEADAVRQKVELWRKRIAAAEKARQGREQGGASATIFDAWQAMDKLGGHPDAEPHRSRAEKAASGLKALEALAALPHGEDEASDRALLKTLDANSRSRSTGCAEAAPFLRPRPRGQGTRRTAPARTEEADRRGRPRARAASAAVIEAAEALPPRYGGSFADRIRQARERARRVRPPWTRRCAAAQPSDLAIADAAERARAGGTWPADPAVAARCELAIRRRDLLRSLDAISRELPLDEQDAQWAASWDNALLADCGDAREHRARYAERGRRNTAFAELERGSRNRRRNQG